MKPNITLFLLANGLLISCSHGSNTTMLKMNSDSSPIQSLPSSSTQARANPIRASEDDIIAKMLSYYKGQILESTNPEEVANFLCSELKKGFQIDWQPRKLNWQPKKFHLDENWRKVIINLDDSGIYQNIEIGDQQLYIMKQTLPMSVAMKLFCMVKSFKQLLPDQSHTSSRAQGSANPVHSCEDHVIRNILYNYEDQILESTNPGAVADFLCGELKKGFQIDWQPKKLNRKLNLDENWRNAIADLDDSETYQQVAIGDQQLNIMKQKLPMSAAKMLFYMVQAFKELLPDQLPGQRSNSIQSYEDYVISNILSDYQNQILESTNPRQVVGLLCSELKKGFKIYWQPRELNRKLNLDENWRSAIADLDGSETYQQVTVGDQQLNIMKQKLHMPLAMRLFYMVQAFKNLHPSTDQALKYFKEKIEPNYRSQYPSFKSDLGYIDIFQSLCMKYFLDIQSVNQIEHRCKKRQHIDVPRFYNKFSMGKHIWFDTKRHDGPNPFSDYQRIEGEIESILGMAVFSQCAPLVDELLRAMNLQDKKQLVDGNMFFGYSPLDYAISSHNLPMVNVLMKHLNDQLSGEDREVIFGNIRTIIGEKPCCRRLMDIKQQVCTPPLPLRGE